MSGTYVFGSMGLRIVDGVAQVMQIGPSWGEDGSWRDRKKAQGGGAEGVGFMLAQESGIWILGIQLELANHQLP